MPDAYIAQTSDLLDEMRFARPSFPHYSNDDFRILHDFIDRGLGLLTFPASQCKQQSSNVLVAPTRSHC